MAGEQQGKEEDSGGVAQAAAEGGHVWGPRGEGTGDRGLDVRLI